ncbi:MAG TPA: hypothetical protein VGR21_05115 [Cryptosporangiaceae bacterium]|nr:hypothetical protein [Cryptosporangiaceae bacterium]
MSIPIPYHHREQPNRVQPAACSVGVVLLTVRFTLCALVSVYLDT